MDLPPDATLKEKLHAEKVKLRELTFKKKLEYIWDYYKYPILGICAGLIIAGSMINTRYINPSPDIALFISWNAGFVAEEQTAVLSDILAGQIINEEANEMVIISPVFTSDEDPAMAMANVQRTLAMLAVGEIDLFILDSQQLEEYSGNGFLLPLESTLERIKMIDPNTYRRIEENVLYAPFEAGAGDNKERVMGINIGTSPLLTTLGYIGQELYFSIASTAGRINNAEHSLIVFFK